MNNYIPIKEVIKSVSVTHKFNKPSLIFLNTSDIIGGKIINKNYLPVSKLKGQAKKTIEKDDILFSEIRPKNRHFAYIDFEDTEDYVVSTKLMVLRKINQVVDNKYFYYFLTNDAMLKVLQNRAENRICSFPQITFDLLSEYKIRIPDDIKDQKAIVNVLCSLDSKIELNNRINTELEQVAKILYDYWFVQFDFPDKNGKPYKTNGGKMIWSKELKRDVPEGWGVERISDLLPVLTGKKDANFATENGKYNFFTCAEEISMCDEFEFEGKAILLAGNGNFNIKVYEGKFNAYQRTYVLIPYNDKYYTVVYLAVMDRIRSLTNGSRGSIVKFITKGDIEDITLVLPKTDFFDEYNQLNIITKKIELNLLENQKLAELRDWLLPMLMNGQVTVK